MSSASFENVRFGDRVMFCGYDPISSYEWSHSTTVKSVEDEHFTTELHPLTKADKSDGQVAGSYGCNWIEWPTERPI